MEFQTARQWIPQAGIARRLDISPRGIPRLIDCGDLTLRLIPGCQARFLADELDRLARFTVELQARRGLLSFSRGEKVAGTAG